MKREVTILKNKNQPIEVDIDPIPDWEGFDKLISFLKIYYSAQIVDSYDGLFNRKCTLETDGVRYQLIFDDWFGNSLRSLGVDSDPLIIKIGEDLKERLKDIQPEPIGSNNPDYFQYHLVWDDLGVDEEYRYETIYENKNFQVRINKPVKMFLYTLLINGEEQFRFNKWPKKWIR
ncbi:MAG: hypothetical protein H0W64_04915 [Gammaproteobacteria bacterium]|nr:hypothetical protein [Gammaproteobacteria bacterium]